MTNTKYTIREMLMDNKDITEFLLQGKENTYANVKGLFDTKIFDYMKSLGDVTNVSAYIRFDVKERNHKWIKDNNYQVYITIDVHSSLMHTNGNVNNLDMLANKVVEDVKKTFYKHIGNVSNIFSKCEDNRYF